MIKIRLTRLGRKKRPYYRMVVLDVRSRRNGAALDLLGFYDPVRKQLKLDVNKANAWVAKGAQVSDTAKRLLGLCEGKSNEIIALPKPEPKGQHAPAPAKAADPVAEVVAEAEAPAAEVVAEAEEAPVVEEATA
jgi:small subunit ribosomal protein S16